MKFVNVEGGKDEPHRSFSIMQWSLFATCLFFCSGHWYACNFQGLICGVIIIIFLYVVYDFVTFSVLHSLGLIIDFENFDFRCAFDGLRYGAAFIG